MKPQSENGIIMGCMCFKASSAIDDSRESPRERLSKQSTQGSSSDLIRVSSRVASSRRRAGAGAGAGAGEEIVVSGRLKDTNNSSINNSNIRPSSRDGGSGRVLLIDKHTNGSTRLQTHRSDYIVTHHHHPGIPKAVALEADHVAAGWPPWLAAVAGDAIRGWIPRKADSFEKLDKVSECYICIRVFSFHIMLALPTSDK